MYELKPIQKTDLHAGVTLENEFLFRLYAGTVSGAGANKNF